MICDYKNIGVGAGHSYDQQKSRLSRRLFCWEDLNGSDLHFLDAVFVDAGDFDS